MDQSKKLNSKKDFRGGSHALPVKDASSPQHSCHPAKHNEIIINNIDYDNASHNTWQINNIYMHICIYVYHTLKKF